MKQKKLSVSKSTTPVSLARDRRTEIGWSPLRAPIDYDDRQYSFREVGSVSIHLDSTSYKFVPIKNNTSVTLVGGHEVDRLEIKKDLFFISTAYSLPPDEFRGELVRMSLKPQTRGELLRFYFSLKTWESLPRTIKPPISAEQIWYRHLTDENFADNYQNIFDYSVRETIKHSDNPFVPTEIMFTSFDDYFNIKSFLKFTSKKCSKEFYNLDYKIKSSRLKSLRQHLMELLPDKCELPNDIEFKMKARSTSSWDRALQKKSKHHKIRDRFNKFSNFFQAVHTDINVYPTGERCGIVLAPDSLNTINWCSKFLRMLLDHVPGAVLCDNSNIARKRIKEAMKVRRDRRYYLPDLEKSGLLLPREICKLVKECLAEKYPFHKDIINDRFKIYENFDLIDEKKGRIPTKRGVGLGMAAEIVTLVELAISNMSKPDENVVIASYQFHDDQVTHLDSKYEELFDAYHEENAQIHEDLAMPLQFKKSLITETPIFLEEYGDHRWKDKSAKVACLIGNALAFEDIRTAKAYIVNISKIITERCQPLLQNVIKHFGYEFYPEESQFDYLLGGWLTNRDRFMNDSLCSLYSRPDLIKDFGRAATCVKYFQKNYSVKNIFESDILLETESFIKLEFLQARPLKYDLSELDPSIRMLFLTNSDISRFAKRNEETSLKHSIVLKKYKKLRERLMYKRNFETYSVRDTVLSMGNNFVIPEEEVIGERYDICFSTSRNDLNFLKREGFDMAFNYLISSKYIEAKERLRYVPPYQLGLHFVYDDINPHEDDLIVYTSDRKFPVEVYQYASNPMLSYIRFWETYGYVPQSFKFCSAPKNHGLRVLLGDRIPDVLEKEMKTVLQVFSLYANVELDEEKLEKAMFPEQKDENLSDQSSLCARHSSRTKLGEYEFFHSSTSDTSYCGVCVIFQEINEEKSRLEDPFSSIIASSRDYYNNLLGQLPVRLKKYNKEWDSEYEKPLPPSPVDEEKESSKTDMFVSPNTPSIGEKTPPPAEESGEEDEVSAYFDQDD